jgi:DNA invertase Pin-like site-specific DNA recombinase
MTRCAAYIRVSTEEQVLHGYSLEAQKEALTDYAAKHNLVILDYYIDEGFSARKKMSKRKEFLRMLADINADRIDLVIFTKLDRWFRNISDYYKVQEILEAHQVNWKTIYENYDTSTASGRLHINIMLSVAQDEADRTSERIKVVFQNKRNRGEVTNGSHPLGFCIVNKRLVPDEEGMKIVKDIFDFYEVNQSIYAAAHMLREKYNLNFCNATISRVLKNKIYTGEYGKNNNSIKPVIDEKRFNYIQSIKPLPKERKSIKRVYLFSGLLTCRECGKKLTANHSSVKYKDTTREYHLYRCKRYVDQKLCTHNKVLNERKLEAYLVNQAKQILTGLTFMADIKDTQNRNYHMEVNRIKNKLEKLKELYIDGLLDKDTYLRDYESLNTKLLNIPFFESPKNLTDLKDMLNTDFESLYLLLSDTEKRVFWRSLIAEIIVDKDNQLTVRYK